jgi:hypothetical protein
MILVSIHDFRVPTFISTGEEEDGIRCEGLAIALCRERSRSSCLLYYSMALAPSSTGRYRNPMGIGAGVLSTSARRSIESRSTAAMCLCVTPTAKGYAAAQNIFSSPRVRFRGSICPGAMLHLGSYEHRHLKEGQRYQFSSQNKRG